LKKGVQKTPFFTYGSKTYAPGPGFAVGFGLGFGVVGFFVDGFVTAGFDFDLPVEAFAPESDLVVDVAAVFAADLADVSAGFASCFTSFDLVPCALSADAFFACPSLALVFGAGVAGKVGFASTFFCTTGGSFGFTTSTCLL
jgi:hypothetical protein